MNNLFTSLITPPTVNTIACFFIFRERRLLLDGDSIPLVQNVEELGLTAVSQHYLGHRGNQHYYAAEIGAKTAAPEGMALVWG